MNAPQKALTETPVAEPCVLVSRDARGVVTLT